MSAATPLLPGPYAGGQSSDVVIVRWPEEASSVERLRTQGRPRLLLVAPDSEAPTTVECDEDWIRLPAEDGDVRVRISTLVARAARHSLPPEVKGDGRLAFRGRWVGLSGAEEGVARVLCANFGEVVENEAVESASGARAPTPNALRVSISRLRKRIAPLGLVVRRVHNRGYVMDVD